MVFGVLELNGVAAVVVGLALVALGFAEPKVRIRERLFGDMHRRMMQNDVLKTIVGSGGPVMLVIFGIFCIMSGLF